MAKYFYILFISLFFLTSCSENENESAYIDCEWIFFASDTVIEEEYYYYFDTFVVSSLFKLNSATNYPDKLENEIRDEIASKYIHYYKDEGYFEYEKTSETEKKSFDVSGYSEIQYKKK